MRWKLPPGVHGYETQHGKPVFYLRRPGLPKVRLHGFPGSPEFLAEYEAAKADERGRPSIGAGRTLPAGPAPSRSNEPDLQLPNLIPPETRCTSTRVVGGSVGGVQWRDSDYRAMNMVRALKRKPLKGYFDVQVAGVLRRFTRENVGEFVDRVPIALARTILRHHDAPATLVPIPNSHVVDPATPDFHTLTLACQIAGNSGGRYTVQPALVFQEPQQKSHEGGPRDPNIIEAAYKVVAEVLGPVILIDDVCTLGGHLIAARWKLHSANSPVALACTFGRSTKQQVQDPLGPIEEMLDVTRRVW